MDIMNEIQIGNNVIGLKNNLVKTNILPKISNELDRDVNIQGNVIVEGSVFARNIVIDNGPVEFRSAVFALDELHVKSDAKGDINFRKAVATSNSIVALLPTGRCIFGTDINASCVKLKNCFVGGSIFAGEIQLENCVVLGGCFASKKLTFQNVIMGTFNAPEVNAGGVNYLLYPSAFSVEPMSYLPGTELYNISLADLGALYKGEPEKKYTGKILMDFDSDSQRTVLIDENNVKTLINSYSVSGRVLVGSLLDFEKMENHLIILSASLNSQILKVYTLPKGDGSKSAELTNSNVADFFFKILVGTIQISSIDGTIPFDELKKQYQ